MKDHFVKIAVTLIGKDASLEIIRHMCLCNKISAKEMRKIQKEILSCDYVELEDKKESVTKINEIHYNG